MDVRFIDIIVLTPGINYIVELGEGNLASSCVLLFLSPALKKSHSSIELRINSAVIIDIYSSME
jgi:hypothetical protein